MASEISYLNIGRHVLAVPLRAMLAPDISGYAFAPKRMNSSGSGCALAPLLSALWDKQLISRFQYDLS